MRDQMNNMHVKPAFAPKAAVTDTTAQASTILDTRGADANTLVMVTGTLTDADATFALTMSEADAVDDETNPTSLTGATAVAAADLVGTLAQGSFQFDDDNECRKIGYLGRKRWIQATVTPVNNTGNLFLAGVWVQGRLGRAPAPNPPQ